MTEFIAGMDQVLLTRLAALAAAALAGALLVKFVDSIMGSVYARRRARLRRGYSAIGTWHYHAVYARRRARLRLVAALRARGIMRPRLQQNYKRHKRQKEGFWRL